MSLRQRICTHGGGGSAGSKLPKWATDIGNVLFRDPAAAFQTAGEMLGPSGYGAFGDMLSGYLAGPTSQMFAGPGQDGGWGDSIQQTRDASNYFANNAMNIAQNAQPAMNNLNMMAYNGAQDSAGYNALNGAFLEQGGRGFNQLMGLVGQGGGGVQPPPTLGMGEVGRAALAASKDVGPDSELYKSTLSFMTPQVRSAYSARGLGTSGQAANAEADQARQLADSFAQRANTERNQYYNTAASDSAQYNSALANMYGSSTGAGANMYGTQMQGATAATEAPSRIFSTMQGGLGQGIQNIGNATGQYLQPMQMNQAGMGNYGQAQQMPLSYQQSIYNYLRSPQTQLLGIPSGTGQQSNAGSPNGLFGDLLGVKK